MDEAYAMTSSPLEAVVNGAATEAVPVRNMSLLEYLRRDAARYAELGAWYSELGFWVGATYRFGAWCWTLPLVLRLPLGIIYRVVNRFWRLFLHVNISVKAEIGPGLCLIHPSNIMIPTTTIGENFLIFHEVTLGTNLMSGGMPRIGSNVDVYVGARLLGGITIGDNSKIGANCVVTSNVRANSIVFSAPTRVLQRRI